MGAIASQITSLTIVYSTVYSAQIKENIKALHRWPLCGEFPSDHVKSHVKIIYDYIQALNTIRAILYVLIKVLQGCRCAADMRPVGLCLGLRLSICGNMSKVHPQVPLIVTKHRHTFLIPFITWNTLWLINWQNHMWIKAEFLCLNRTPYRNFALSTAIVYVNNGITISDNSKPSQINTINYALESITLYRTMYNVHWRNNELQIMI